MNTRRLSATEAETLLEALKARLTYCNAKKRQNTGKPFESHWFDQITATESLLHYVESGYRADDETCRLTGFVALNALEERCISYLRSDDHGIEHSIFDQLLDVFPSDRVELAVAVDPHAFLQRLRRIVEGKTRFERLSFNFAGGPSNNDAIAEAIYRNAYGTKKEEPHEDHSESQERKVAAHAGEPAEGRPAPAGDCAGADNFSDTDGDTRTADPAEGGQLPDDGDAECDCACFDLGRCIAAGSTGLSIHDPAVLPEELKRIMSLFGAAGTEGDETVKQSNVFARLTAKGDPAECVRLAQTADGTYHFYIYAIGDSDRHWHGRMHEELTHATAVPALRRYMDYVNWIKKRAEIKKGSESNEDRDGRDTGANGAAVAGAAVVSAGDCTGIPGEAAEDGGACGSGADGVSAPCVQDGVDRAPDCTAHCGGDNSENRDRGPEEAPEEDTPAQVVEDDTIAAELDNQSEPAVFVDSYDDGIKRQISITDGDFSWCESRNRVFEFFLSKCADGINGYNRCAGMSLDEKSALRRKYTPAGDVDFNHRTPDGKDHFSAVSVYRAPLLFSKTFDCLWRGLCAYASGRRDRSAECSRDWFDQHVPDAKKRFTGFIFGTRTERVAPHEGDPAELDAAVNYAHCIAVTASTSSNGYAAVGKEPGVENMTRNGYADEVVFYRHCIRDGVKSAIPVTRELILDSCLWHQSCARGLDENIIGTPKAREALIRNIHGCRSPEAYYACGMLCLMPCFVCGGEHTAALALGGQTGGVPGRKIVGDGRAVDPKLLRLHCLDCGFDVACGRILRKKEQRIDVLIDEVYSRWDDLADCGYFDD